MIMQYKAIELNYFAAISLVNNPPYKIPTLPGDPGHDPYNVSIHSIPQELILEIQKRPPEEQQEALRMVYLTRLATLQTQ